jgi:hypothetical protein
MQDAYPMCAFSGGRARSSVLGVRPSASDQLRYRVPGPRCQIAGTRYLVPGTWYLSSKNPDTGYAGYRMQDKNGSDSAYLVPGTWYLAPGTRDRIEAENRAGRPGTRNLGPMPHSPVPNLNKAVVNHPPCPIALLPYCLIALLPYCPTAVHNWNWATWAFRAAFCSWTFRTI